MPVDTRHNDYDIPEDPPGELSDDSPAETTEFQALQAELALQRTRSHAQEQQLTLRVL